MSSFPIHCPQCGPALAIKTTEFRGKKRVWGNRCTRCHQLWESFPPDGAQRRQRNRKVRRRLTELELLGQQRLFPKERSR